MRAAAFHGAGDVRIEAAAAPGEPGPGEGLIAPPAAGTAPGKMVVEVAA